jgi:hypothetical protein
VENHQGQKRVAIEDGAELTFEPLLRIKLLEGLDGSYSALRKVCGCLDNATCDIEREEIAQNRISESDRVTVRCVDDD